MLHRESATKEIIDALGLQESVRKIPNSFLGIMDDGRSIEKAEQIATRGHFHLLIIQFRSSVRIPKTRNRINEQLKKKFPISSIVFSFGTRDGFDFVVNMKSSGRAKVRSRLCRVPLEQTCFELAFRRVRNFSKDSDFFSKVKTIHACMPHRVDPGKNLTKLSRKEDPYFQARLKDDMHTPHATEGELAKMREEIRQGSGDQDLINQYFRNHCRNIWKVLCRPEFQSSEREDVYQEALSLVLIHAKADSEKPFNPKWSTIIRHVLFPVVHRGALER